LRRKSLSLELKADAEGGFRAVFSTFNVIDRDGDVTIPGAFTSGQAVRIAAWGHNWGALPVGKGVIDQDSEKAWVDGEFFLDTSAGADTYKTVKSLGPLQEWSYGFDVRKSSEGDFDGRRVTYLEELDVFEVSPVLLGAGIGTHTEAIKAAPDPLTLDELVKQLAAQAEAFTGTEQAKALLDSLNSVHSVLMAKLAPPLPATPLAALMAQLRAAQLQSPALKGV
jgi:HK97 family phage prohead protease